MKNIFFYGILIFLLAIVGGGLFLFKNTQKSEEVIVPVTRTIIPENYSEIQNTDEDYETQLSGIDSRLFLELSNDEIFLDSISADLNNDGIEDQIIVIKKLLNPFLHLVISIQNQKTQEWKRIHEIRTSITEPKSLDFQIIKLNNSLSAISYAGMASDNQQTLAIQKIVDNNPVRFEEVVALSAEIKIQVKKLKTSETDVDFSSFKLYAYDSDPDAPNTLNQIETEYVWDNKTEKYEKNVVKKISGEKIEAKLLKKLKTGNTESITEFLSGLWFKEMTAEKNENRSFYFDKNNKNIIFNLANIQEIYEITSINTLRYGLFFTTHNKSIPNIIRKISIEVKGVDEIQVRVIENVRRIKFGTTSLWSGSYKKNINESDNQKIQTRTKPQLLKTKLLASNNEWTNSDNVKLTFENNKYKLTINDAPETGIFNILGIQGQQVLQLQKEKSENSFYLIELEEKNKQQILSMTKVILGINEIVPKTNETIILKRQI